MISMKGAHWILDDLLPRVIRTNVLPIVALLALFILLYIFLTLTMGVDSDEKDEDGFPEFGSAQPDYTALYEAEMTDVQRAYYKDHKKLDDVSTSFGFYVNPTTTMVECVFTEDGYDTYAKYAPKKYLKGERKRTWEVMRDQGSIHNYDIENNNRYNSVTSFLIKLDLLHQNENRNVPPPPTPPPPVIVVKVEAEGEKKEMKME